MLIVIGSDGKTLGSQVSKRFGRANYYISYDTDSELFEALENSNQHESELEAGDEHDNLRHFLDEGVKVFIVGNIGPHAFQIVKTPETAIYLARKMTAFEAIEKFLRSALTELSEPTAKKSIAHNDHENTRR